jgi:hypothetical protein
MVYGTVFAYYAIRHLLPGSGLVLGQSGLAQHFAAQGQGGQAICDQGQQFRIRALYAGVAPAHR